MTYCPHCKQEKEDTEFPKRRSNYKARNKTRGRMCRRCLNRKSRERVQKNPERIKEYLKKYRAANLKKMKEAARKYYEEGTTDAEGNKVKFKHNYTKRHSVSMIKYCAKRIGVELCNLDLDKLARIAKREKTEAMGGTI